MAQDTDVQTTGEDREAVEAVPLVHPQETSHSFEYGSTYRDFLISGMPDKVARAERLYKILDERDLKKRIGQFRQCRSNAWFVRHKTTHEVRVASSRCNLRWCPLCIKTKRFIMQASIIPWVKAAQKPKFITLTLKHSKEPLPAQIDRLYKSFKLLRGRKLWKDRIKGGLWFFQVKWSAKSDSWHPHLHVICEGRYVNNRNLQSTWLDITGDSMVVDIRAVKDPKKTAEYVSRYATAPANMDDLSDAEAVEVFDAMAGRRVCGTFGTGKAIQLVPKKCPAPMIGKKSAVFGRSSILGIRTRTPKRFSGHGPEASRAKRR